MLLSYRLFLTFFFLFFCFSKKEKGAGGVCMSPFYPRHDNGFVEKVYIANHNVLSVATFSPRNQRIQSLEIDEPCS